MKAAILRKLNTPLEICDNISIPELKDGQVFVKIAYSGVCQSQLMEVMGKRGDDPYLPHMLGHEATGTIIKKGANVTKVDIGDNVILTWIKCAGCDEKNTIYNDNQGIINAGSVTTFSNYAVVSENRVVSLPKGVELDVGVLFGCALTTGGGTILNQINPKHNSTIVIWGLGGVGMSALMVLNAYKMSKIIAIDISSEKLDFALSIGATHTINAKDSDPIIEVMKITDNNGVDYCFESSGIAKNISLSINIIKKNSGKVYFASHPPKGDMISIDPHDLISGKEIYGTWGGNCKPDRDIPILAKLYLDGSLPLKKMIEKIYPLDDINQALLDMKEYKVFRPLIVMDHII